jgi:hypothetical protein
MKVHLTHDVLIAAFLIATGVTTSSVAEAGQCSGQIDQLQALLSKSDARLEPSGKVATDSSSPSSNSPGAVQQQNADQAAPSTADAPAPDTAPDATGGKPPSLNVKTAQENLTKARQLNQAGQEQACQDEVAKAKAAFGAQ